ncbi:MAG: PilZ domain-containing protein [Nitrospirae bacterium]|nr:PilZ domain-containing protein [Nitrospirota bacterium]
MPSGAIKKLSSLFKPEAAEQAASKPQSYERRVQPRFTTQFRSTFSRQNEEGQGRTLDISSGGCKIESDMKVAQGAKFECRLHVPGLDWPLRIDEATVRWVEGNTFGIGFTRISPDEFSKLKIVLINLEQDE